MKKNWLKNKLAGLAFAFSSVEKTTFSQGGESTQEGVSHTRRSTEGTLLDSLINGVLNQEVMDLRWRTYKVIEASEKLKTTVKYRKNKDGSFGDIISIETSEKNISNSLNDIIVEPSDNYPLEMVVDNSEITMSQKEALDAFHTTEIDDSVDALTLAAGLKTERPILIQREFRPKFDIENYATKLHVRTISDTEKLMEFYVSKYPIELNVNSRLFIGEVKKGMTNPELCNMLQIDEIGFISLNTLGANNHCEYHYINVKFDKIVEFNGFYVIKFKATVLVNGENTLAKYMQKELETKYQKKEKRKSKR